MPRILGVDIPKEKKIEIALRYIYGIGPLNAIKILKEAQIQLGKRASQLTQEEISKITAAIQKHLKVEGDLRREITSNIKRLMDIGSWRGLRHKRGLPVRGQRTKTNARTRKGPRKLAIVVKREEK